MTWLAWQRTKLKFDWSHNSLWLQRKSKDDCAGTLCNRHQPPPPRTHTMWAWHCSVYMATWYTNTPKSWGKKEWGGCGWNVILLKVLFKKKKKKNQVIFIPSFAVRVHSFGLQRQVRENCCAERRAGQKTRNFSLACEVQNMITEMISLKGGVHFFSNAFCSLFLCRLLKICLYPEWGRQIVPLLPWPAVYDFGCSLVHFSCECYSGLLLTDNHAPSLGLTFL